MGLLTWKPMEEIYRETPPIKAGRQIHEKFRGPLGLWCRFYVALSLVNMVDKAVAVVHGPSGCTTSLRNFLDQHYQEHFGMPYMHVVNSDVNRDTVILGGEEAIERAIQEVERDYQPDLIIVLNTCATEMIMDNVAGVVQRLQPKVKAKLHWVPCAGYTTCWVDNRETALSPFVDLIDPPKEIQKGTVNLLGNYKETYAGAHHKVACEDISYPADVDELARIVRGIGLKVHRVLLGGGDYEYLRTASEAEANAQVCSSWGYPLSWGMEKRFGTPWMKMNRPIGIDATVKWIKELAGFMKVEKQADQFINEEYGKLKDLQQKAREVCKGKVAIIEGIRNALFATTRPFAQARFALEMGMQPYFINIHPLTLTAEYYTTDHYIEEGLGSLPMLVDEYAFAKPVNIDTVMADLGLSEDEVVYIPNDVFRYCRAGRVDPSNIPRYDGEQPFRKVRHCSRGDGFTGARAAMRDLIENVAGAKRKKKATLMGRVFGKGFDFE